MNRSIRFSHSLLFGALFLAGAAMAQSVSGTGSNAGKAPVLAPPANAAQTAPAPAAAAGPPTNAVGQTPGTTAGNVTPGVNPLPPLNANGIGATGTAPPAVGRMPTRTDSAADAFRALDPGNRGFVTRAETDRIQGFMGFDNADTNRDGQLTQEEFANAWKFYAQ